MTAPNTHMLYFNDFHRDHGAIALSRQAIQLFSDTIVYGLRDQIAAEGEAWRQWFASGRSIGDPGMPATPYVQAMMERHIYDHLKIAAAFELHLKARLVEGGYIVHVIKDEAPWQALRSQQKSRPIRLTEMTALAPYVTTQTERFLPGVNKSSLNFSWIVTKADYTAALNLPTQTIGVIDEYRELRNQIHLPGDVYEAPRLAAIGPPSRFLLEFINTHIVDWANGLLMRHPTMAWPPLTHHA